MCRADPEVADPEVAEESAGTWQQRENAHLPRDPRRWCSLYRLEDSPCTDAHARRRFAEEELELREEGGLGHNPGGKLNCHSGPKARTHI